MFDFIMGIIMALWVTWFIIRILIHFEEEENEDVPIIVTYLIDFSMVIIFALYLVFRFRGY